MTVKTYDTKNIDAGSLLKKIKRDFPNCALNQRTYFKLYEEYTRWFLDGQKNTTVRFDPEGIDVPHQLTLPLIVTRNIDSNELSPLGDVRITSLTIKNFANLNDADAKADGFKSESELKAALADIYPNIEASRLVSIYHIQPCWTDNELRMNLRSDMKK